MLWLSRTSAFEFPKNNFNLIWFDSHQKIDSIQFSSLYCWVMKSGGGEGTNWCLDTHFSCLCVCCCTVASTVQSHSQSNIAYRLQAVVESNGPIFWDRIDSNRFVKWIESNRFESRIGMHYPGLHALHSTSLPPNARFCNFNTLFHVVIFIWVCSFVAVVLLTVLENEDSFLKRQNYCGYENSVEYHGCERLLIV